MCLPRESAVWPAINACEQKLAFTILAITRVLFGLARETVACFIPALPKRGRVPQPHPPPPPHQCLTGPPLKLSFYQHLPIKDISRKNVITKLVSIVALGVEGKFKLRLKTRFRCLLERSYFQKLRPAQPPSLLYRIPRRHAKGGSSRHCAVFYLAPRGHFLSRIWKMEPMFLENL